MLSRQDSNLDLTAPKAVVLPLHQGGSATVSREHSAMPETVLLSAVHACRGRILVVLAFLVPECPTFLAERVARLLVPSAADAIDPTRYTSSTVSFTISHQLAGRALWASFWSAVAGLR